MRTNGARCDSAWRDQPHERGVGALGGGPGGAQIEGRPRRSRCRCAPARPGDRSTGRGSPVSADSSTHGLVGLHRAVDREHLAAAHDHDVTRAAPRPPGRCSMASPRRRWAKAGARAMSADSSRRARRAATSSSADAAGHHQRDDRAGEVLAERRAPRRSPAARSRRRPPAGRASSGRRTRSAGSGRWPPRAPRRASAACGLPRPVRARRRRRSRPPRTRRGRSRAPILRRVVGTPGSPASAPRRRAHGRRGRPRRRRCGGPGSSRAARAGRPRRPFVGLVGSRHDEGLDALHPPGGDGPELRRRHDRHAHVLADVAHRVVRAVAVLDQDQLRVRRACRPRAADRRACGRPARPGRGRRRARPPLRPPRRCPG